jgi:hypothetical protein
MEERAEELVRLEVDGLRDGRFPPSTCHWPRVDIDPAASTWRPTWQVSAGGRRRQRPRPATRPATGSAAAGGDACSAPPRASGWAGPPAQGRGGAAGGWRLGLGGRPRHRRRPGRAARPGRRQVHHLTGRVGLLLAGAVLVAVAVAWLVHRPARRDGGRARPAGRRRAAPRLAAGGRPHAVAPGQLRQPGPTWPTRNSPLGPTTAASALPTVEAFSALAAIALLRRPPARRRRRRPLPSSTDRVLRASSLSTGRNSHADRP